MSRLLSYLTFARDYGSSSITSSTVDYEFENGRRYHAYKAGRAWLHFFLRKPLMFTYKTQIIHCPTMRQVFTLKLPVDTLPADMGGTVGA